MDISFMFGRAHASGAVVAGPGGSATVTGSAGFTQQFSFGYQFTSTKAGSLYLETPLTFVIQRLRNLHEIGEAACPA